MVNCINLIIEMSPRFILGRENVPCVAEVVNRSLKADCTDYNFFAYMLIALKIPVPFSVATAEKGIICLTALRNERKSVLNCVDIEEVFII